jgi:glycerol-3-phosphate dehydrogenase
LQRFVKSPVHFKKTVKVKFMCFFGEVYSGMHVIGMRERLKIFGFHEEDFNLTNGPAVNEEKTDDLGSLEMPDSLEMTRRIVGQDYIVIVFSTHGVLQHYQKLLNWISEPAGKVAMAKAFSQSSDPEDKKLGEAFLENEVKLPKILYSGHIISGNSFADFDHSQFIDRIVSDQKRIKNVQ